MSIHVHLIRSSVSKVINIFQFAVFSEFLEGICRLGVLKYGHIHNQDESTPKDKLSHYECIKLAIKKACSVVE